MWKLTIQDDQGNKTVVHLVRDEYTIGREEGNAVRLTERNISRRHARLAQHGEEWRLHDVESYNGCFVNGARVGEPQKLMHGDLIQLGDYRLTLEDETLAAGSDDGVLTLPGRPGMNTNNDRLVLIAGPGQGQEFALGNNRMVIGRGEDCEISVNHPSVSRVHAEVRPVGPRRWEIVDLSSANGIRVNGSELPASLLDSRDVVELGDVVFKFLPAGEIYIPSPEDALRADIGAGTKGGLSMPVKLGIGAALLAMTAGLVLALRRSEPPAAPMAQAERIDPVAQLLKEATGLRKKGNLEAAVKRANQIPETSNLRASPDFRSIQDAWADALFEKASHTQDPSEKQALLDRVARAPSVDPARRRRAADEIEAMRQATVNVTDLPSDESEPVEAVASSEPPEPSAKHAAGAPTAAKTTGGSPKKASQGAAKATPTSTLLVRKNPFGDP